MWDNNRDIASTSPRPITAIEKELVQEIQDRILDLHVNNEYLEPKNLVRFIRARNGSLNQAEQMIRKNVEWITQEEIHDILSFSFPPIFETCFPWKVCGFDDFGGPIIIIQTGLWEPSTISGMKNDLVRYFLFLIEKCRRFGTARMVGRNTTGSEYVLQFSVIVDCLGLGWKHYLSYDGIQAILTTLRYFEANYPDSLRLGVAVNCPSVLNMIWKIVKPLVSPATHTKLRFLYEDDKQVWRDTLTRYFPEDRFPQRYGGTLSDSYKVPLEYKECSKNQDGDENGNA